MRVVFDTNVVLDVLLERHPHYAASAALFTMVETGELQGSLCATTVTTIYYIVLRTCGSETALESVRLLLGLFGVAPVAASSLNAALGLGFSDYEDAVLHESARASAATAIVTRDAADFDGATLRILSPDELLAALAAE